MFQAMNNRGNYRCAHETLFHALIKVYSDDDFQSATKNVNFRRHVSWSWASFANPFSRPCPTVFISKQKEGKKSMMAAILPCLLSQKKKIKTFSLSLSLFVCQVKGKEKPKHFYLYLSRVFLYVRISFKVRRRHKKEESRQQSNQVALYTQDVYPKKEREWESNKRHGRQGKWNKIKSKIQRRGWQSDFWLIWYAAKQSCLPEKRVKGSITSSDYTNYTHAKSI